MKKLLLLTVILFAFSWADAQIRILQIDPANNTMVIKNFGGSAVNVSGYRTCQFPIYPSLMSLGSPMMVNAGMEVTLDFSSSTINLMEAGGNMSIYTTSMDYNNPNNMADFVQWGASSGGRESVADAKGIWVEGNFLMGSGPYMFTGDATEMGNRMPLWSSSMGGGGMMGLMYKPHSDQLLFAGRMNGDQIGVTTDAVGIGSFMLNSTMDTICYQISVNGLSGEITAIHLHNAAVGMNGPVAIDLSAGIEGNIVKGSITGMELTNNLMNFLKGELYINLHTMANPMGEIRGQVYLEKDMMFEADADTMQQVHVVNASSDPIGLGTFTLGQNKKMVNFMFVGNDLTGTITAAHLHYGAMGSNGSVAVDLSNDIMMGMPVIKGSFDASMIMGFVDSLMAGNVYINVHTMMNAAGELRGQLKMNNSIAFDAMIDTMQQTMPVMGMNNGMGIGSFSLNYSMDTLRYNILIDGLSGPITAIHLHDGIVGMNGNVMIDLSSGINGNRVQGMILAAELPQPRIAKLLRGGGYLNIHTAANPTGELRGQVFKMARDGYVMGISGDMQAPPVMVNGMGAGLASVDRNWTNAHYMMVVSDLTGPITAAHFHKASMGDTGPVAFDLSSSFSLSGTDDAAFGFWTDADMMTPFMMNDGMTFWNDSIYLNIHTMANASGELRGQAKQATECSGNTMPPVMMGLMYKPHSDQLLFAGRMNGDQIGVTTDALGIGSFMLNSTMDTICYEISVNGLSGEITAIHLHNAAVGMNGPVAIDLSAGIEGNIVKGSISGTDLTDNMMNFLKGELYINLHTTANPAGEIRGQVYLEKDMMFEADADTMQQVHVVNASSNPIGLGTFTLGQNKKMVNFMFVGNDLTGMITAAHLHYGAMGSNGSVAVDLSNDIMMGMPVIKGSFDASMIMGFVDSLMAGNVYINVHTMMNAAGELRGQLKMNNSIAFDAMIDTMQQNMPVMGMNNGMGIGSFSLNYSMDTLRYNIVLDGLSGPITAIHLHDGIVGMDGNVMIDLSSGINGNRVQGMILAAELPQPRIAKLLRGGGYLNIHAAANPAGELRGQVFKMARDGYTLTIDGDQQTPPITVSAVGAGLASVDRNWTNAHYMMVVSDLTGPITAAHFHKASMGDSGPVAFDLSSSFSLSGTDDAAFGFWTNTDMMTPFMMNDGMTFWNDSIYLNIHTMANASGELRGQADMTSVCNDMITGISDNGTSINELTVYPNPSAGNITVNVSLETGSDIFINVYNTMGQVVFTEATNGKTGTNTFDINLDQMPEGAYFVSVKTNTQNLRRTLILSK